MPPARSVAILTESADATAILAHARDTLTTFNVPFTQTTIDARTDLAELIAQQEAAGTAIFIAANTSIAPLSAAIAALTQKPVLAVPLETPDLTPLHSLQASTTPGPPVGTLAIGKPGATNAALLAIAILANTDPALRQRLRQFRADQTAKVLADPL